jgi:hypothetical protein
MASKKVTLTVEIDDSRIREKRELLAKLAHEQWSGWMHYLFSKGTYNEDGTWTMPVDFVNRWHRQMTVPYDRLPEEEKDSDRKEADRVIGTLLKKQYG